MSIAMAGQPVFLGFSPSGRFAALAEVETVGGSVSADLRSIDVDAGAWSHWPAHATGVDVPGAVLAAQRTAGAPFAAQRIDAALTGRSLTFWLEGAHDGAVWPRRLDARVRTSAGVGVLTLTETPVAGACGATLAVTPGWTWADPSGRSVDLLRVRGPRRWPACTSSFALADVREGPSGALVFLLRATEIAGDDVRWHTVLAATRLGAR